MPPVAAVFEIKSADLPLLAFQLKSADLDALAQALQAQEKESPGFFDNDPVLVDLDGLPENSTAPDFRTLLPLLKKHGLHPVAARSSQGRWQASIQASGLPLSDDARIRRSMASQSAPAAPTPAAPVVSAATGAMVIDRPLRSGQQVYAKGRDLLVMAMVNPGAEVLADGHIHVYAPLRGKAIAGARGNTQARIFALNMDAELISIAGVYRTSENPLPASVRGHAAQVYLHSGSDGERLVIEPLKA